MGDEDDVSSLRRDVHDLKSAVFGYWNGGERVPGLIEQTNAIAKLMATRDAENEKMRETVRKAAWQITRPIIGMLVVIGVAAILTALHGPIDPNLIRALTGH
jgi:hypothetical protein